MQTSIRLASRALALAAALVASVTAARADFVGATLESKFEFGNPLFPLDSETDTVTTGFTGFEFLLDLGDLLPTTGRVLFDIDATAIRMRLSAGCNSCALLGGIFFESGAFVSRARFDDTLDQLEDIFDVRLTVDDPLLPFASSRISFTTDSIVFDFEGLQGPPNDPLTRIIERNWQFEVTFADPSAVSEPGIYGMLLGLALLILRRRNKILSWPQGGLFDRTHLAHPTLR